MKTVNSISGGRTSAYLASKYPSDINIFALVKIEDIRCRPKDKKLVQDVSDKIGQDFIATAEDDLTLRTIFELEQYLGKEIQWVVGESFDWVVENKGGWLPNKLHRYCTVEMKLRPIFRYLYKLGILPVEMRIGFRSNEEKRAIKMLERTNEADGLIYFKDIVGKWEKGPNKGKNKWESIPYHRPRFPLIEDGINKSDVQNYWHGKPVKFARFNNCVGCFHRNPIFLKKMFDEHPEKMNWFELQEKKPKKGTWRSDVSYAQVRRYPLQLEFEMFGECDSGHCGI